ncbi:hypothetical protein QNI23_002770 [Bermanella sp. WJH001]|uniref:hypothetical protein n=1 Tax=Bermanella sp. WJH001 TaxID=3048005 RepID=UPI0024BD867C|nr:hypothetical protein [Bermanella sp. WJH001]MDJ1538318.1 hypothetical protein [Bermanella sp. WJH001]
MLQIIKIISFFVLLIGSLASSAYYLVMQIEDKFTEHQEVTLNTILSTTTLGLVNWKKQVVGEFNMWLNSPVVSDFVANDFRTNIDPWLNSMESYTSASSIYFSNTSGVIVASSDEITGQYIDNDIRESLVGLDIGDYKFRLNKGRDNNGYSYLMSFPLLSFDYEVLGYAHFELDLKK